MLINIFNEKNKQKYQLSVDEESTLGNVYQKLCQENKETSAQCVFALNEKILKWEQTIRELKIFYNLDSNAMLCLKPLLEQKEVLIAKQPTEQPNIKQNNTEPPARQNNIISANQFNLIKKAFTLKSKEWHQGNLEPGFPKNSIPQTETIFADRYQIISPIVEKHIINVYSALDLSEQKLIYLFTGIKHLVDYTPPINFTHTFFLRTFDVGEYENYTYSAVEYRNGKFLANIIKNNDFSTKTIIELLVELANIVHELHKEGHMHGNLTPKNILITSESKLFLSKNNLAYKLSQLENNTKFNKQELNFNIPVYFSPETYYHHKESIASDIFSFGVIAYHLLTKISPFGFHKDTLLNEEHISVHIINPKIPENLSLLISSMLESEVDRRPPDMETVIEELLFVKATMVENNFQFQLSQDDSNINVWKYAVDLIDYGNKERLTSIEKMLSCTAKNDLGQQCSSTILGALSGNEKIFEMIPVISNVEIRNMYIFALLKQINIPKHLISLVSPKQLLDFLQKENLKHEIQLSLLEFLENLPIEDTFFELVNFVDKVSNTVIKNKVFSIFEKHKLQLASALFIFLFSPQKRKIRLAQEILEFLGFELLSDAAIKFKKGDDNVWRKVSISLEEKPILYQSILCAFTLLLKDKNRNIRWLAGNGLFLAEKSKALPLYLNFLKEQGLIYELLQIMNFAGGNIAFLITNNLQDILDKQLLQYMWHIRWNTNDENRIKTCQILGKNKVARSIIFLVETLFSSNKNLSKEAEKCIIQIGVSVMGELIPFIADTDMKKFIQNIFISFGKQALPPLVSFLEKTNNIPEKKSIIKILGKIGGEEAVCAILPYVASSHKSIYELVKSEMVTQGNICEEWLLPALKGSSLVRFRSQEILLPINPKAVLKSLIEDIHQDDISLNKQSVKLITQMPLNILTEELKNIHVAALYKIYFLVKQQQLKKVIEQFLLADSVFTEIKKIISNEPFAIEKLASLEALPILTSILLNAHEASFRTAHVLVKNFPEEAPNILVKAWYALWENHLIQLILCGQMNIHDLRIIEIPQIHIYEKCLLSTNDKVIPFFVNQLPSMAILAGVESIVLIGKIQTNLAVTTLQNIQKNKSFSSLWRQTAHVALCAMRSDFELLIQVMQQQKNAFVYKIAEKVLIDFLSKNMSQNQKFISAIFNLNAKEVLENLMPLLFVKSKDIKSAVLFLESFSDKQKEVIVPILLKNLQNPQRKVVITSIHILGFFSDKSILNALQVLLSRVTSTDEEMLLLLKKTIHKVTEQEAKENI